MQASAKAQSLNVIVTLTRTFVFTLFISPENFGLIALSLTFTGFISILKDFGYTTYIIQQDISEHELIAINTRALLYGIISFLVVCIIAVPISNVYHRVELLWILPITGIQFILNAFTMVPLALMRKNMEFNKVGIIDVWSNVISVLTGLLLLLITRSYWVILLTSVLFYVVQMLLTFKYSSWKHQFSNPVHNKLTKSGATFGLQLTAFNVLTFLSVNLDSMIIGKIAGIPVLGNYTKSYEFGNSNIDKLVKRPIQQVYFSDLSGKDVNEKCRLFFQYLFLLASVVLVIVGPALIFTELLVENLLNSKWRPLIGMLPPFFLCTLLWMTMSLADQLLIASNNLKRYLLLGVVKSVVGSVAIVISSFWGAQAMAYSFLIYHLVLFVPFCYYVFTGINVGEAKVKAMIKDTCIITGTASVAILIPFILLQQNLIGISLATVIFLANYIVLHAFVWSQIAHYAPFKVFFWNLVAFRITKPKVL